jgi:hypothetical protein
MRHTSQQNLKANKIKVLLVSGYIKEAITYAKEKGVTVDEFSKIAKKVKVLF